jgi:hypothetical protein
MNIVPTNRPKRQEMNLDSLLLLKTELKQEIEQQKDQINTSMHNLLSPVVFTSFFVRSFTKGISLMDGIMAGFKFMRTIRSFFKH